MLPNEALIGTRVRTLVTWPNVPKDTEGVIDEDYTSGVMVAWDLPEHPLPPNYRQVPNVIRHPMPLRDGFNKAEELHYLELVKRQ